MKPLCVVLLACAMAVYAQSPSGQTTTQGANNHVNTVNNPIQGSPVQTGNPVQMNNHAQYGNMQHNPAGQMVNNPANGRHMVNYASQTGHVTYPSQSGHMVNNPAQSGHMFNAQQRQLQNILNPGFDATRIAGGPLNYYRSQMMQHMKQNQGVRTGPKSTQTGLPPHLLPLMLRSDRGTKIAIMNMMANNPAMAKFLPLAATGGLSDNMMRMLVLMGSQSQGQGPNPLMAMAAMGGGEMSQIAPLLLATQTEGNSASATGNTGAAAANPGSQTGPNSFFDIMMMSQMM